MRRILAINDAIRFHFEYAQEIQGQFTVRMSKLSGPQRKAIIDYLIHMEGKGAGSSEHAIGILERQRLHHSQAKM